MPSRLEIESYGLDLNVDFPKAYVKGTTTMHLRRGENPLILNAVDMKILGVQVDGSKVRFTHDAKKGSLKVLGVPAGRSSVSIDYSKKVSDEVIFGLYKSRYGKEYILATDLEPAQARTVFPCRDHPAFKAAFDLSITTQEGLSVISNTPLISKRASGSKIRHVFATTPRMSTYLLFFAIGKFEEISKRTNGKEIFVAARAGEARNGRFILDVTPAILQHYAEYFGVPYPLKKLHMVALPEYHTGAMENWGAISSREAYLLLNDDSGVFDRQYAGIVMAHEIAHQWFGDLVTMKWWDDLWLNESFATFMECKSVSVLHPDWEPWTFFLRTQTFRSQAMDALSNTHPIQVKVKSPEEAGQVFDAISYGKGASVLRMVESYVGEEPFRKGVTEYLKRFSYSNATGADLWRSVQKTSGKPVTKIMGAWITKAGFPLVRLSHENGRLTFSQSTFQLTGKEPAGVWPIPLTLEVNGERKTMLFDKARASINVPNLRSINVNVGHTGFYSVLCTPELYRTIETSFASVDPYDKGGLMNDLFLFLQAGKVAPETYFRFVSLCSHESHPLVVEAVSDQLSLLTNIADESTKLKKVASGFATAQIERLGLSPRQGEESTASVVREVVSSLLARLDTGYTEKLAGMFERYDSVDPNLKEAVAVAHARTSGNDAYLPLVKLVKSMSSEVDRGRIYSALCSFRDPSLVEKTLELGISGEVSRSDSGYTLTRSSFNPFARETVWSWIKKRYDRLWEIYAGSQQILLYYEVSIPRCAVGMVDDVKKFLSGERMKQGGMSFRRTIESLEIRTKLREKLLAES